MKISYFEEDQAEYERAQQVKDDDGNWTTQGELDDLVEEWADLEDQMAYSDKWKDGLIDEALANYEKNLDYDWRD